MKLLNIIAACWGIALASSSFGADTQVHLRGEIAAVNNNEIVIVSRNGKRTTVTVPEEAGILDVSKTNLAAINENSYLGIAAAPAGEGKVRALGVMVFPEGARGLNEGHFPWDKGQRSTMTNATVARLAKKKSTTELEMRFGEKTQTVILDSATIYGQFVPGKRDLLAIKSKVVVIAVSSEGKPPVAHFVMVGRDGFLPPI